MDEWINNIWYILPTECYSASKMKESLVPATTSVSLGDMMLSDISRSQREHMLVPLLQGTQNMQIHRDRNDSGGFQRLRGGDTEREC